MSEPVSEPGARRILGIGDLTTAEIDAVLGRADALADGAVPARLTGVVGLGMFETSLRTRAGFSSAAQRLGLGVVEVDARRASELSMPESLSDTVRALSGYVDALVVRAPGPAATLSGAAREDVPWLNAGDRGERAEHPSQALIDVFAMERLVGPVGELRVALCGDLRMRAAQSLLALLARRPPRDTTIVSHPDIGGSGILPPALAPLARHAGRGDLHDIDVLVAVGIPHGAVGEDVRARLRVDTAMLAGMKPDAIVLSPMPIIDEIATPARRDPRMRYFVQSDLGLFIRIALLEMLLGT